jgi:hypothetical protein
MAAWQHLLMAAIETPDLSQLLVSSLSLVDTKLSSALMAMIASTSIGAVGIDKASLIDNSSSAFHA